VAEQLAGDPPDGKDNAKPVEDLIEEEKKIGIVIPSLAGSEAQSKGHELLLPYGV
jgi:hypothetical protein